MTKYPIAAAAACIATGLLLFTPADARVKARVDPLAPAGHWTGNTRGAASTPPMGWNSWNAFRTEVDEQKVMGAAQALVDTGLAKLGYVYVNLDDGWWLRRDQPDGRMRIRTRIFPSADDGGWTSFRPFTDRLHGMGLKAGLYTDVGRNACSQAFDLHSPNLPQGSAAEREVGLDGHVAQDIGLYFSDWGFDYLKVDACGLADYAPESDLVKSQGYRGLKPEIRRESINLTDNASVRARYESVAEALMKANPDGDYVFSICDWGMANVRTWGKDVGNSWRTSSDITPSWTSMLHNYDSAAKRALYAGPGHWNDPDILYIGKGDFDENHLTEARSHFSLWAMLSAPLLISYDLRTAPKSLLDIWSNADIIRLDQDPAGNQATVAYDSDDAQILVKTLSNGHKAVALLNRTAEPVQVTLLTSHLKFAGDAPVTLTDLWSKASQTFQGELTVILAAHETRVFDASGQRALPNGMYLSEMPGALNIAVDGATTPEPDPTIHRMIDPWSGTRSAGSRPQYAGWGGAQADTTPYGGSLQLDGTTYGSGIGILANSRMEVRNDAGYGAFTATVGVDDSSPAGHTVRFYIYGDGKLLAYTKPLSRGQAPQVLLAEIRGIRIIELVTRTDTAAGEQPVVVTWAEARLTGAG